MKINKRVVNFLNPCQVSVTAEGNASKSLLWYCVDDGAITY